jgi:predicted nucleotidyltransferase
MLHENSLEYIRSLGSEFGARRILLFGSCLNSPEHEAGDIDIAVEGLSRGDYWDFWRRVLWADGLGEKTVDVVRIEDNGFLVPIILDEGIEIYVERKPPARALERV